MKITARLILGYTFISLLVGIVGVIGYVGINDIFDGYDNIVKNTTQELIVLENIKSESYRMQMEALGYSVIVAETEHLEYNQEDIDAGREDAIEFYEATEEIEKWKNRHSSYVEEDETEELKIVENIDVTLQKVENLCLQLIKTKQQGISGELIIELKEKIEEAEEAFSRIIDSAIAAEVEELVEQAEEEEKMVQQHILSIIIISIGGVLFALILSLLLAKSITRPLIELKEAAVEISRGNMDVKINVKLTDELGEMAYAFNNMRVSLKVMMDKYDNDYEV